MRAIMTSGYGVHCDVGWIIELLIDKGIYDDYGDAQTSRDIERLGRKLVLVGGRLAPVVVALELEKYTAKHYVDHVAAIWRLDDIDEADIDADDFPTLSVAGVPPARPSRRAATG